MVQGILKVKTVTLPLDPNGPPPNQNIALKSKSSPRAGRGKSRDKGGDGASADDAIIITKRGKGSGERLRSPMIKLDSSGTHDGSSDSTRYDFLSFLPFLLGCLPTAR